MDALEKRPFGRLSQGVSSHVFSFWSTPEDMVSCQATCKSWESSIAWARPQRLVIGLFLEGWDQLGHWLANHQALIQHVKEVNITFNDGLRAKVRDVVLRSATRLESLIVENLNPRCCRKGHVEVYLAEAQLAPLPRSLTSLCLRDVDADAAKGWASVPSGLQLRTLDLTESNLPSPLPTCMASLTRLHLWLDFCNESRPIGASDFDDVALGRPMLQQLRLETDRGEDVDSWEPLTRLPFLRDLTIEAHPGCVELFDGPFPAVDLDAFPAIQSFSAKHCAGV